jgi:colanic acid/amylovoran biosynthesis glycosyltransferase
MFSSEKSWIIAISLFFFTTILSETSLVDRPLKILVVVSNFPSPSQIFILNIIIGLIDQGHDVSIFSFQKGDKHAYIHPNIKKYNLLDRVVYNKLSKKKLRECDIVFCQFGYVGKKISEMKRLSDVLRKRKLAVCFRGADITKRVHNDRKMYDHMFKIVDLVLPVCDYFKQKLIALGCKSKKITVYHSAIDCSQFLFATKKKRENDTIHLISVSRLVQKKGIDFAIQAIGLVTHKYPNIHFTIVGDGPEKPYLDLLIKQLQLEDKITLYGWSSQKEVISLLKKSHIFLLPSRTALDGNEEGIANALKEAMAMGLISIATLHAGTPELIEHGVSGFLVPEKSIVQLAQAIEYVIEHPQEWESIALTARKKIEDEFEIKKLIQELEQIFYKLLNK